MRKIIFSLFLVLTTGFLMAQDAYEFKVIKENAVTPIKNQYNTGTCWSFSGVGVIESDLLRMGKGTFDLSEMYIVRRNYEDKAQKYARLHGNLNFSPGGSFADVFETLDVYGLVPDEVYTGLQYGSDTHNHGELDKMLKSYMDGLVGADALSPVWQKGISGILDGYLGELPTTFTYKGKQYTPQSFAKELGISRDNYVSLTSFTHHPFYKPFAVEVPDNWRWALSYNLPLEELMKVMENAVMEGYTIAWATDVSEAGFSRDGIAIVPDEAAKENAGSDQARWLGLSTRERDASIRNRIGRELLAEKKITQEMRQKSFDNYSTTDDHGMQIYGIARDQNGNKYFMVKNSWGEAGPYNGYWYASFPFVAYKTLSIVLHRDALPKDIARKLGL